MTRKVCNTASFPPIQALLSISIKSKLYFNTSGCSQSEVMSPDIEQLTQAKRVALAVVDIDENGEIASRYGVTGSPAYKAIDSKGVVLDEVVGGSHHAIDKIVSAVLQQI